MHRIQRIKLINTGLLSANGDPLDDTEIDAVFYGGYDTCYVVSDAISYGFTLIQGQYEIVGESTSLSAPSSSSSTSKTVSISDVIGQDMKSLNIEFK